MTSECERCAESAERGYNFCLWCGRDVRRPAAEKGLLDKVMRSGTAVMVVCSVILILELAAMFWRFPFILDNIRHYSVGIIILTPLPTVLFSISGWVLQAYYVGVVAAASVSVTLLFLASYRHILPGRDGNIRDTPLYEVSVLFACIYALQVVLLIILMVIGVDAVSPMSAAPEDEWKNMFLLLEASVWEELLSRVLLIGVPMAVLALAMRGTDGGTDDREWWKHVSGGFGIGRVSVVFIFLSALVFGVAHIPGWDLWKAFPTFIAGLAMGYLFVKYGVHASISFHFLTNSLPSIMYMAPAAGVAAALSLIGLAFLGIPFTAVYLKKGIVYMKDNFARDT